MQLFQLYFCYIQKHFISQEANEVNSEGFPSPLGAEAGALTWREEQEEEEHQLHEGEECKK